MKKILKQNIFSGITIALSFFFTLCLVFVVYAGFTSLTKVGTGSGLTSASWNQMVDNLDDLNSRAWNLNGLASYYTAGNIGIGTDIPSTKLEVAGQVKITGGTPGAGKVLTSDASGLASWQAPVSGKVLQVGYASKADSWSALTSGDNFYDVPGLSFTITPASINNKILITLSLYGGVSNYQIKFRILRNGVPIILGAGEGGRPKATGAVIPYDDNATTQGYQVAFLGGTYMDTPSTTSATTYKIQMAAYNGNTVYLNRSNNWQNSPAGGYDATPVSSMTVMEIAN